MSPGYFLQQNFNYALGSVAVPERGNPASFAPARQGITGGGDYLTGISANQQICALGNGDRALGVLAQGEAWDAKRGGFFLNATRVGEDERRLAQETQKIEIPNRRNEPQLGMMLVAPLRQMLLGAWMHGKDYRHFGGNGIDRSEELVEFFSGVHVGGAMKGEDAKALPAGTIPQSELITDSGPLGDGQKVAQRIDHHIANHKDAFSGQAFFQKVRNGIFFRDKEIVGERIGQDAVDFFGHASVKAAESCLDVSYADTKFGGGERNSDGGIDIAYNQNKVGLAFNENRLNALQNFRCLRSMRARANFEIDVRRGNAHLAKENVRQLFIIVLAGVDEDGIDFRMALHLVHEGRDFWEVGACADDVQDFQTLGHEAFVSGFQSQYSIREIAVRRR